MYNLMPKSVKNSMIKGAHSLRVALTLLLLGILVATASGQTIVAPSIQASADNRVVPTVTPATSTAPATLATPATTATAPMAFTTEGTPNVPLTTSPTTTPTAPAIPIAANAPADTLTSPSPAMTSTIASAPVSVSAPAPVSSAALAQKSAITAEDIQKYINQVRADPKSLIPHIQETINRF